MAFGGLPRYFCMSAAMTIYNVVCIFSVLVTTWHLVVTPGMLDGDLWTCALPVLCQSQGQTRDVLPCERGVPFLPAADFTMQCMCEVVSCPRPIF